jgi:hypothetical protein
MFRPFVAAFFGAAYVLATAGAADVQVLPPEVSLTGPEAYQQLLVFELDGREPIRDLTAATRFASSNAPVATVDAKGTVRAVGDGEATVIASHGSRQASVAVRVSRTKEPFDWSFRNHVIPLMTKVGCNSGACHGALAGKGGLKLSLRGYDPVADHFVLTRQALGRRVNRAEPARSLMLLKPTMALRHGGGQRIDVGSADYRVLGEWIAAGAPAPRESDVRIQRLELFPGAAVMRPSDRLQFVVRAWYSDGHAEDVTRWARFNSSEAVVTTVTADGQAQVVGHGESAITVAYSNLVASARIAAPFPGAVDPGLLAAAGRNNYIDDLVLKKLAALHIPPSPRCTDAEFIRRAYLDAAGVLPTPEEVRQFLASRADDKRARLIDALLERPEFVDYWTYKWCDLFLVSTRKLPGPAVWAFYQYLRQNVAGNKPWDRLAHEILTARGNTLHNGAANYFVLHKDVTELNETTAITFLGMSLTCCRCHNHPLEKWTQDQYWSMANLFARVALKNGDQAGEITVQDQPAGDVLHPRRGVPMPAAPLDAVPLPADSPLDRRQYLADWLIAPNNPYFARALVNRVWRNFMGRGLVEAEDDLRQTNPPTNEELLASLARDFIQRGYDVKALIRGIMNSATYQRSSTPLAGNAGDDRFYSHYLVRRLSAEVILDAYSQVTGVATTFPNYPTGTRALQLPDAQVASPFLDVFGRPERVQTCSCERQQDSSIGQALHLNNGQTLNDKLRAKGSRVEQWLREKISDQESVRRIFALALAREPTATEMGKFKGLMTGAAPEQPANRREVLEDLFWAVLSGREFLFNQ